MPDNGSGGYSPPGADFPAVAGTLIESTKFNNVINDIATALSNRICKDGQTTVTANLPMSNFRHTGVAAATQRSHYGRYDQVQDSAPTWGGTAGGTATALTISLTPAIPAYATGQTFRFKASATNTGASTLNVNALGAKAIQANGLAIEAGVILQNGIYQVTYDGVQFQLTSVYTPAWSTGDVKTTFKIVADTGWVMMDDGTIGNAGSGGTTRANADTEALFTLLWNNTADAQCAVSGGRGANAAADFAGLKTIALPKSLGRALAVAGAGSGLTARVLAEFLGTETKTITTNELPASGLAVTGTVTSLQARTVTGGAGAVSSIPVSINQFDAGANIELIGASNAIVSSAIAGTTANMGTAAALGIMNPMLYAKVMIKL